MSKKKNKPFAASLTMSEAAAVIDVTGVIGWDADAMVFNDLVDQAKQAGATALTVRINSVGGYCYDGLSMGDKLRTCGMATRGEVYGCAMSMASYLLQCCTTRVAHRNATLMFHQPSACICGTVDEMLQEATYLVGMRDRMFEQMGSRCGKSGAELSAEHMTTKYYTADQALAYGFLDAIEGEESAPAEPAPQESPEDEPAAACRVFAYESGMRLAMLEDEDPEEDSEDAPAPQENEQKAPQEPAEDPEDTPAEDEPTEPDKEQDAPKESQESPAPQTDPAPEPQKDDDDGEEDVTMTRSELEALVARRTAEKVAAMGISVGTLAGAPATAQAGGSQYTRAELDAMPGMVRLRLLRENPSLAARYMNS